MVADPIPDGLTLERKIGGTTYIVTAQYSPTATETAVKKMRRLLLKESEKVSRNSK